jgi:hypothetical protein
MKRINKRDTIEGIIFILMTVGVIGLLSALYQLNGVMKDVREYRTIITK